MNDFSNIILLLTGVVAALVLLIVISSITKRKGVEWKTQALDKLNKLQKVEDKKLLVIELDKLLEFCLKNHFNTQDTFGEILKKRRNSFTRFRLDKVWYAHKTRNKLVHELNFNPQKQELLKVESILKKEIKKLIR